MTLSWLASPRSDATTFAPVRIEEAAALAPVIFRGKVLDSKADWQIGPDGVRRIYTDTQVRITETLKGVAAEKTVTLRELGGEVDGIGLEVPGRAIYAPDSDIVLMATPFSPGGNLLRAHGMSMGQYDVVRDSNGQEAIQGAGIAAPSDHGDADRSGQMPLEDFRKLLKKQASSSKPSPSERAGSAEADSSAAGLRGSHATATLSEGRASGKNDASPSENEENPKTGISIWAWISGAVALLILASWIKRRIR